MNLSHEDMRYYLDWLCYSPESPWFDYRIELLAYLGCKSGSMRSSLYKFIKHDDAPLMNAERIRTILPALLDGRVVPALNGTLMFPTKPRPLSIDRRSACA